MLGLLKSQEFMHGAYRCRVPRNDAHLAPAGQRVEHVADRALLDRHDVRAGHIAPVHKSVDGELASSERPADVPQMGADRRDAAVSVESRTRTIRPPSCSESKPC